MLADQHMKVSGQISIYNLMSTRSIGNSINSIGITVGSNENTITYLEHAVKSNGRTINYIENQIKSIETSFKSNEPSIISNNGFECIR